MAGKGPTVSVIGGGVGGLAAACRLAAAGARVSIWERAPSVGGKLREVDVGGAALDAGPSVLTMPFIFDEIFALAGRRLADSVTLAPVEPMCRHFFSDGSRLDLFNDPDRSRAAIHNFAGARNAGGFDQLRAHGAKIFDIVRPSFMEAPVPRMRDLFNPLRMVMFPKFLKLDSGRTLWDALSEFFPDERLRQLYGRYATYNGSSPFHCPATLTVIVHVEQQFGIHGVQGGMYRLAEALADCAKSLGVTINTGAHVEKIRVAGGRARGIVVAGETIEADLVVANCDSLHLFRQLLDGDSGAAKTAQAIAKLEPSLSAYVLLARAPVGEFPLAHHNVFFSRDYRQEFRELQGARRPPEDPTVYLCAQDRAPGMTARGDERHLLLTNAPALDGAGESWKEEESRCKSRLLAALARHHLTLSPTAERAVTPPEFEALFPGSRGALYGASSNSRLAAFERPPNQVPGIRGLYQVGGSAHPGAGLPMVALSAKIAAAQATAELGLALPRPRAATPGGTSTR
jgi:1-hydroxycarotenoid 3,4-desaturase